MLAEITDTIRDFITSMGGLAPFLACLLIVVESMIPVLPLCTFITINFISFGTLFGFLISWIFTCFGCFLSYILVKKGIRNWYTTRMNNALGLDRCLNYINTLSLPALTTVLAMPFTPAFLFNIAAGLVAMDFKKFFIVIIISKIFMVYFWGYIGVGIIESFTSPQILIKIIIIIATAYIVSSIVKKIVEKK